MKGISQQKLLACDGFVYFDELHRHGTIVDLYRTKEIDVAMRFLTYALRFDYLALERGTALQAEVSLVL